MRTTLVIGASNNPDRYANKAVKLLREHGYSVIAFGPREGGIGDVEIQTKWDKDWRPETVTLYINPELQKEYDQQILDLHPKRVIFNPGTENPVFESMLRQRSVEVVEACTLVMLATRQY